jgi:lipoate-protein ligase B
LLLQEQLVAARADWDYDLLILLEHPPVITLGRGTDRQNLSWSPEQLAAAGIECLTTSRGGDITCHEPGQLVGYPLLDLNALGRDLHLYLRNLETVLIRTLADYGLKGQARPGLTGVWIEDRKIASIGIAVRRWVSWHGFALNVSNDLSSFRAIVPCGIEDVCMTSLRDELGRPVSVDDVSEHLESHFSAVFDRPRLGDYEHPTPAQTRLA